MFDAVRRHYDEFPEPSPDVVPIGPGQLDRVDDNLHFGWSWSRYRYCFRRADALRALDAGCGTGLTSLALARLNPGARVLGVDAAPRALELAAQRASAAGHGGVEFKPHDLDEPLPATWGPFDFIVCRGVLAETGDPVRVLKHLAAALDHRGLLHVTLPAEVGHLPARQMRQAVRAIAPAGATLAEQAALGIELLGALRPDHPIRRYEEAYSGKSLPSVPRFIAGYLGPHERDWSLPSAIALLESAGLRFLFAATRAPYSPDRVMAGGPVADRLKQRVDALDAAGLAVLIDAIDPMLHADEYRLYACLAEFEPRVPAWADEGRIDPASVGRLIPHRTGLAKPADAPASAQRARVPYRVVTGAVGELFQRSHLLMSETDGTRSCAEIDTAVEGQTGASEPPEARQNRWLELANAGFVVLEPADLRQHVDCVHLGQVLDRLDCACPRRWVRACALHTYCTLATVPLDDERHTALEAALARLGADGAAACATCPDYSPEA